jgi:enterochelin esterase-like enzyme
MTGWREIWRRGLMALGPTLALGSRDGVTVERLPPFTSAVLGEARTIDVFLPRGYAEARGRVYPVLYANDGQDMQAVELARQLDSLQLKGAMEPTIVVAIHATERVRDYGTAGTPNAQGLGDRAGLYERFLLEELMPAINAKYRTAKGPAYTAIMGWSLGGLSAFDLAWNHPDQFGLAGVFSGSFWWRTSDATVEAKQVSRIMHQRVRQTEPRPRIRAWFETARMDENSDRDGDGVIDSIQDTEELVSELARRGFRRGVDVVHLTVEGKHDLGTWKRLLPEFLVWVFPGG